MIILTRTRPQTFVRNCSSFVGKKSAGSLAMQPPWNVPTKVHEEPVLKVYNSLTRTKVRRRTSVQRLADCV
jgi:hypothetical protein